MIDDELLGKVAERRAAVVLTVGSDDGAAEPGDTEDGTDAGRDWFPDASAVVMGTNDVEATVVPSSVAMGFPLMSVKVAALWTREVTTGDSGRMRASAESPVGVRPLVEVVEELNFVDGPAPELVDVVEEATFCGSGSAVDVEDDDGESSVSE